MLMLVSFYEFLFSAKYKTFFLFLFGLFGGFSFWFCYSSGIAFVACLITWLCADAATLFSKKGLFVFLSFLIGFDPWIATGFTHSFNGSRYLLGSFWGIQSKGIFWINERLLAQIFFSFPRSFSFLLPNHLFRDVSAYGYCLLFCMAILPFWLEKTWAPKFLREDNKKNIFFLIYPILFCYLYAVTNFVIPQEYPLGTVDFRYYTPLYFFAVILLSLALSRHKIIKWILAPLLIFTFIAQRNVILKEPLGRGLLYNGYSYIAHGARWGWT